MQDTRKQLLIAVGLIVAGVVAFFVILAALGIDPDQKPLGVAEWVLGFVLIAPGFRYLIRWRRARDAARGKR